MARAGKSKARCERGTSMNVGAMAEGAELRDRALRLLAVGVGDHMPIEVREQVGEIARRLAELEPPVHQSG